MVRAGAQQAPGILDQLARGRSWRQMRLATTVVNSLANGSDLDTF
jgi:hypothetical protein